ncbi:MAG: Gfo/Idh/MocA family oxidoreductase [Bauldia sp.]|nr:Gfo/Idh/MocA family oxidoreductase [Bauldia sp.]
MTAGALVVGTGSIGTRHREILAGLGLDVASVSRRGAAEFDDIAAAVGSTSPDYVVVATETGNHHAAVAELAACGYGGRVLVEKPLFDRVRAVPGHGFAAAYVGYNMRFHPVLAAMREVLAGEEVLAARADVGQYFSEWRPGRAVSESYSARRADGGGVLRDLSHEIDYLLWLFGPCRQLTAQVLASRTLAMETDDVAAILMTVERCPVVQLTLDYHRQPASRDLVVITGRHTIVGDLLNARLWVDGTEQALGNVPTDRNATYVAMHRAVLEGAGTLCTFAEGLAVLDVIEAAERASEQRAWIAP